MVIPPPLEFNAQNGDPSPEIEKRCKLLIYNINKFNSQSNPPLSIVGDIITDVEGLYDALKNNHTSQENKAMYYAVYGIVFDPDWKRTNDCSNKAVLNDLKEKAQAILNKS